MPNIGTLGSVVFESSLAKLRTISNYSRDGAARLATHDIIGKKPVVEFLGPGLEHISFTMQFNSFNGIDPEEETEKLRGMRDAGEANQLIINNKPVTDNKWLIESIAEKVIATDGTGKIVRSDIDIKLVEYVDNAIEGEGAKNATST